MRAAFTNLSAIFPDFVRTIEAACEKVATLKRKSPPSERTKPGA